MDQNNENNKGIGLNDTLKDSGTGVKFEKEHIVEHYSPETPKVILWVLKYSGGYVKDEKQANYILIGFVTVAIIISLFLVFGGGERIKPPFEGGSNPQSF